MGDVVNLRPTDLEVAEERLEECVLFLAQAMDEDDPAWQAVNSLYAAVSALKRVVETEARGGG